MSNINPGLRPALWLLLTGPILAQGNLDNDTKIQSPLPHFDSESKTELWIPPAKPGSMPSNNSHLTLAERIAIDQAQGQGRTGIDSHAGLIKQLPEHTTLNGEEFGIVTRDWMQHFQLDQAADGTLWAYGGSYKASFDAQGAEYVPFLGSTAPRNFPLELRLESITLGGEPLSFDAGVMPSFDGDSAVYARGSVQERYELSIGQIEQLFIFNSLPGTGELVVRMDTITELVGTETDQGFAFEGPYGSVLYGFATVLDAAGNSVAAPTELVTGGIEIRVPAAFIATAQMPLTIDPVVSTFSINSDTTDDIRPDVAYDSTSGYFMVCWERLYSASDHDVWAESRTTSGALVASSGSYIDFTTSSWSKPRIANNRIAAQFLVVAERIGSPTEIWGRTRQSANITMGTQFMVSSGSGDKSSPDVGGDPHTAGPTYYCVVWERAFSVGVDHDIHARLVTSGSVLIGSSLINVDNSGGSYDKFPSVSNSDGVPFSSTQEWNITWQREFNSSDWDIRGAQIHWQGTLTTPTFSLDFSIDDDRYPASSSPLNYQSAGARTWMAVYQRTTGSGPSRIQARALKGGDVIGQETISDLPSSGTSQDKFAPDIDTNGDQFFVVWSELFSSSTVDKDIYGATFYLAGGSIHMSEDRTNMAFSSSAEDLPRCWARNSSGLNSDWVMAVWGDGFAGDGNIEGGLFDVLNGYGADIGTSYCAQSIANSAGKYAFLHATGSANAGGEPLHLQAYDMPINQYGIFLGSPNGTSMFMPGGSQGFFCIGQPFGRFNLPSQIGFSGSLGMIALDIDTNSMPLGSHTTVLVGDVWRFQAWYRDINPNQVSNFTDAVTVVFF